MSHPLGVLPLGNYYVGSVESVREKGLGFLSVLSDEILFKIVDLLDPKQVVRVALASKVLRCFAFSEDVWKRIVLDELGGNFEFYRSWRMTYSARRQGREVEEAVVDPTRGFYSDLLYQPWLCATIDFPEVWLEGDNVERIGKISIEDFRSRFETPNEPVVLTEETKQWASINRWTRDYLKDVLGDNKVLVGNYSMKFQNYLDYCDQQIDEMPLYLFDKHIFADCSDLAADYEVPEVFSEDLFSLMEVRPDYRWLIMGPRRSGSTFHKDPNSTSAWNAVVSGSKKWILFPPYVTPPGVHQSEDGSEVATPISIIEWFLNFYADCKDIKARLEAFSEISDPLIQEGMKECIVREGEILFVPRGWWHLALNLEETLAITQNYVSPVTLPHVLSFLKTRQRTLVSGLPADKRSILYDEFLKLLAEKRPDLLVEQPVPLRQETEPFRLKFKKLSEDFKFSFF